MGDEGLSTPIHWAALARDVGLLLFLVIVAIQLFGQADKHRPPFAAEDIHVVEAPISGFTTVQVWEQAAAPSINSRTVRSRSALLLARWPTNILFYIPGSPWRLEEDVPIGTLVRLEVTADPRELAERARANPNATFLQEIVGLRIGDRVSFRAADSIERAEAAVHRYRQLGAAAVAAALLWLGWVAWSRRRGLKVGLDAAREW